MPVGVGGPYKWPKTAWWTNTDDSCLYDCQLMEYLYWGFQSYTGNLLILYNTDCCFIFLLSLNKSVKL